MGYEFHFVDEDDDKVIDKESNSYSDSTGAEDEDFEGGLSAEGSDGSGTGERTLKVRLDKWLWAARFFKTRALARAAVEAGRVFYNGERSKPTREIEIGAILQIRLRREITVIVKGLSTRRRSTEEAMSLFEETEESKAMQESHAFDFNDDRHHRSQFNFAPFQDGSRDRRQGRFLRRSFNRQDQPPGYPQQDPVDDSYENEQQPAHFDREERQPLSNDSSFPYPQQQRRHDQGGYGGHAGYRNDHSGYRGQDQRGRPHSNMGYRNQDRNQDNTGYRQSDNYGGYRNQEYRNHDSRGNESGYGHRHQHHSENHGNRYPQDSGYRQHQDHYHHRQQDGYGQRQHQDSGYRHSERNQEGQGYRGHHDAGYRNQDNYGNQGHRHEVTSRNPQDNPQRGRKQAEEFEEN